MRNLKYFFILLAFATFVASCSDDDNGGGTPEPPVVATCTDNIQNGDETGVDCGGPCQACPEPPGPEKDGEIAGQDDVDLDVNDLKGDVTANVTLAAGEDWILSGPLTVKAGAILDIEPGTTIKAIPGGTDVYIVVEQGAQINAPGTEAAPIVMTSNAGAPRPGDWGGLVLAGRAPINSGDTADAEVIGITYGGTDEEDNSGTLTYVKVEYTGARINQTQEFNGITFYGVGRGTTVNHITAAWGDDDGLEWFGGTVNVTNALVVNVRDDWFDWAEGWSGTNSNFYGLRAEGYLDRTDDPRGIEGDGNEDNNAATPLSNPTIDGITLVSAAEMEMADMIKIRRGSSATITNGLIALLGDAETSDVVDLDDSAGEALASTSITANVFNADITDVVNPPSATITLSEGSEGGADGSVFAWAGFELPAIPPAAAE